MNIIGNYLSLGMREWVIVLGFAVRNGNVVSYWINKLAIYKILEMVSAKKIHLSENSWIGNSF